jgi:pilus assembly protein CpaB
MAGFARFTSPIQYQGTAILTRTRTYKPRQTRIKSVRTSTIVMIAFAVVFGLLAVFVAQNWLDSQTEMRMRSLNAQKKPVATRTIVVASKPLRFGNDLTAQNLREMAWPEDALPQGSFAKISELLSGGKRVVLTAIEVNEPVLATKVTGAGQRATLSAVLRDGLKAFTVRVNDVDGVAGFVLPGDRVDVALTRQVDKTAATTDVVLQNARVLAVDQIADERAEKPSVVKAVTLEVNVVGAQKLSLAASVGSLSLMLRKAGESNAEYTRRVTLSDLETATTPVAHERKSAETTTVSVTRASIRQEYNVPIEGNNQQAAAVGQ